MPPPRSSVETECAALKVACRQCKGAKALSLNAAALGPKGVRFEIKGSLLVQRLSGKVCASAGLVQIVSDLACDLVWSTG